MDGYFWFDWNKIKKGLKIYLCLGIGIFFNFVFKIYGGGGTGNVYMIFWECNLRFLRCELDLNIIKNEM